MSSFAQTPLQHQDQRRLADGLYSRGLYDLALEEYRSLLEQVPKLGNREVLFFRAAESARYLEKPAQAVTLYESAIATAPESELAQRSRYRLAEIAFAKKEFTEAGKILRDLIRSRPDPALDLPARYLLGQVLETEGRTAQAREQYDLLLRKAPNGELSSYAALRLASLGGASPQDRRDAYERVIDTASNDMMRVEAMLGLAGLEASERKWERSAEVYWDLWTRHPKRLRTRQGLLTAAWSQVQAGRFKQALDILDAGTAKEKETQPETWLYLKAVSLQRLDRSKEALGIYVQLLETYPDSRFRDSAGYEAASLSAAAGNHEQVLTYSEHIRNTPGREVEGVWLLAESARAVGKRDDAIRLYAELVEKYPEAERAADARYLQALLMREKDPQASAEALEAFAGMYSENPRAGEALRIAGDVYVDLGKDAKGYDCWKKAISLSENPDTGLVQRTALLAVRLQKDSDAEAALKHALDLKLSSGDKATLRYWLGVVFERNDKGEEAAEQFASALSLNPKAKWTARARMRLGRYYQQTDQEKEALSVFLPLVGEQDPPLPDGLLTWLLDVAQRESTPQDQIQVARALQQRSRPAVLREIGAYAEGFAREELHQLSEAIDAWQRGLEVESSSVESAEAALALGQAFLQMEKWEAALGAFRRAASTASTLERGRLQAEALVGLGRTEQGRENWEAAGRHFLSVSLLFDDPEVVPACLRAAAEAFERAGQPDRAAAARRDLEKRYPDAAEAVPTLTPEVTL